MPGRRAGHLLFGKTWPVYSPHRNQGADHMKTVSKAIRHQGSNATRWNIESDGRPYGQIWTFHAAGEVHPYHMQLLNGFYAQFDSLESAITFAKV
jgi:hypothetical protein